MLSLEPFTNLSPAPVRLLLVEDDTELADGLEHGLRHAGYAVDVMNRGAAALAAAAASPYDVAILDLGLPDMDGLEVLSTLRRQGYVFPVIILTARDEASDRIGGLDAGADDYIVKPFAMGELEARLRAVLRRPRGTVGPVIHYGPLAFDTRTREVTFAGEPLDLPPRERAVLRKLMERGDRVVSKDTLFEAIFGWEDEARPQAIEVYISRLRKRLESTGLNIRSLRGLGYRLEQPGE